MKIFFDTSFLIPALVELHPFHSRARPLYLRAKAGEFEAWMIAQHTLAELYCNLSRLPIKPSLPAEKVKRMLDEDILAFAQVVPQTVKDYKTVIERLSKAGRIGACTYDALIAFAAEKAGVDRLYTFNPKDFLRVWPEGAGIIVEP